MGLLDEIYEDSQNNRQNEFGEGENQRVKTKIIKE